MDNLERLQDQYDLACRRWDAREITDAEYNEARRNLRDAMREHFEKNDVLFVDGVPYNADGVPLASLRDCTEY